MSVIELENSSAVIRGSVESIRRIDVHGGRISAFGDALSSRPTESLFTGRDLMVLPGFVDVHNHGAVGFDVNEADTAGLIKIAEFLARSGVTSWMPTLVPDSDPNYARAISAIDELMQQQTALPIAQAVGVHYEGIFASEKMCGALRPEYFKRFTGSEVSKLPRLKGGVHMMTLAPEIEGGIELVKELVRQGWVVSIGHTRADPATLDRALKSGARHMTHFFNAMTGVHHRDIGAAGWGLVRDGVTFDIIADGIHVRPEMLKMACNAKGTANVSLISDSVAPTGLGDGDFELWGEGIKVTEGRTRNERGSIAGSVCTMLDCVRMMRSLGFSEAETAKMAAENPAKVLGSEERGVIDVGKRADLVGLDSEGGIAFTMIGGIIV